MFFRMDWLMREPYLVLKHNETVVLSLPSEAKVVFRRPNDSEEQRYHPNLICSCTLDVAPADSVLTILEGIAVGVLPMARLISPEYPKSIVHHSEDPLDWENDLVALTELAQPVQPFLEHMYTRAATWAHKVVGLLRWRHDLDSNHSALSFLQMCWSSDGCQWFQVPIKPDVHAELRIGVHMSSEIIDAAKDLLTADAEEPLCHVLFREAWQQRILNPRSALAVGVAAAEVGVKQCISLVQPQAAWLVSEGPSPPIPKMLHNYLPKLPIRRAANGDILIASKLLRKQIDQAFTLRNRLVHRGAASFGEDELELLLQAIKDLLWLLDFYQGHEWALAHIRPESIEVYQPG